MSNATPVRPTQADLDRMEAYEVIAHILLGYGGGYLNPYAAKYVFDVGQSFENAYKAMAETHFGPNKAPAYRGGK